MSNPSIIAVAKRAFASDEMFRYSAVIFVATAVAMAVFGGGNSAPAPIKQQAAHPVGLMSPEDQATAQRIADAAKAAKLGAGLSTTPLPSPSISSDTPVHFAPSVTVSPAAPQASADDSSTPTFSPSVRVSPAK